ncbi:MAG: FadR family transcriptional regulator, partial [Anaerolineales bacterium]|nr:FadR family transcriptional regulator [Anaerolineales bacterium]
MVNGATFEPLKRPNAVEDIINTFKEAILHGQLKPGQRLPSEAELCEQLGVGRGTIREAMKMLRALGVVKIQQGDGTYIADKPTASALNPLVFALLLETGSGTDLLELRALLEIGGYQLAAQKAAAEDWPA